MAAKEQNINKSIVYDDRGIETLDFATETWGYASSTKLYALSASCLVLTSEMSSIQSNILNHFGNKPRLRHEAQAFPQLALKTAYNFEEADFKKTLKPIPLSEVS